MDTANSVSSNVAISEETQGWALVVPISATTAFDLLRRCYAGPVLADDLADDQSALFQAQYYREHAGLNSDHRGD